MQRNQYTFEVARDLITLLAELRPGDSLAISVSRHHKRDVNLLDWTSSAGTPCGTGEIAEAIRNAYYGESA